MEDNKLLDAYEKEFSVEISLEGIGVDELKANGATNDSLMSEVYLRKFWGDEIYHRKEQEEKVDDAQKDISKLDAGMIALDEKVTKICEGFADAETDEFIDSTVLKTKG